MDARFISDRLRLLPVILLIAAHCTMPMDTHLSAIDSLFTLGTPTFENLPTFLPEIAKVYKKTKNALSTKQDRAFLAAYQSDNPETHAKLQALLTPPEKHVKNEAVVAKKAARKLAKRADKNKKNNKQSPQKQQGPQELLAHECTMKLKSYLSCINLVSQMLQTQHEFMLDYFNMVCYWECMRTHRRLLVGHAKMLEDAEKKGEAIKPVAQTFNLLLKKQEEAIASLSEDVVKKTIASNATARTHIIENMNVAEKWMSNEAIEFVRTIRKHMKEIDELMKGKNSAIRTESDEAAGRAMHAPVLTYAHLAPTYNELYKALRSSAAIAISTGVREIDQLVIGHIQKQINAAENDAIKEKLEQQKQIELTKVMPLKKQLLNYLKNLDGKPFAPQLGPITLKEQYMGIVREHYNLRTNFPIFTQSILSKPLRFPALPEESFIADEVQLISTCATAPTETSPVKKRNKSRKKQNANVQRIGQEKPEEKEEIEITPAMRMLQIEHKVSACDGSYFIRNGQEQSDALVTIYDPKNNITITLLGKTASDNKPSITKCTYIPTVKKWFEAPDIALQEKLEEENSLPYETDEESKRAITVHNFAKIVDTFIETHAVEYITHTRQEEERALIIPAIITHQDSGKQEKGYFAYLIKPNGACFHRMFDVRTANTALAEGLNEKGFFTLYPILDPHKN